MTKIGRSKVKRAPSSYKRIPERIPCETSNEQRTNLLLIPPHQVETASEHLDETMKIEEVLDTSRQPTLYVFPKPTSTIDKNEETTTTDDEFQELLLMQQALKSIKNWNFLQPGNEIE